MAPLPPAAAWLCAMALGSVGVEVDARFAARDREVRVEGAPAPSVTELELVPRLGLLRPGRLALTLSYSPRLTLPVDVAAGSPELRDGAAFRDRGEVLHRADAVADGAVTRNLSLRVRGEGAYGRIDLLRMEVYRNEVIRPAGRLAWLSARMSADATATPTRRTTVSAGVAAFETGGADEAARAVVPLQRGVRVDAALRYDAARRDALALLVDATHVRLDPVTPTADTTTLARGGGRWEHWSSPALVTRATLGAAWSHAEAPLGAVSLVTPYAEAGLAHAPSRPAVNTELVFGITPYVSGIDGTVVERIEASVTSRWSASRAWELAGRAAASTERRGIIAAEFWTGTHTADLASLELRAAWSIGSRAAVALVSRGRWQRGVDPATVSFVEWGGAIELSVGARWPGERPTPEALEPRPARPDGGA